VATSWQRRRFFGDVPRQYEHRESELVEPAEMGE
jgi:hypothetical protein